MFDPKDSKTIGYHLFLLPSEELCNTLQSTINVLAQKYDGPIFEPHVTLLARIPKDDEVKLLEKTQQLAGIMKPFEIELGEVGFEDTYFRSLYLKAKANPALDEYHKKALELFGVEEVNTYAPHLSLFYGNISQAMKDEMVSSLSILTNKKFLVDKVYLYRTEGEAQDWVRVSEVVF